MTFDEYKAGVAKIMMALAGVRLEDVDDGVLNTWFVEMYTPNEAAITLLAKDGFQGEGDY